MLELRGKMNLAPEALDAQPGGQLRGQDLDHDLPLEKQILDERDVCHATADDFAVDTERVGVRELQSLSPEGSR